MWVVPLDGSDRHRLKVPETGNVESLRFSPNSKRVVYYIHDYSGPGLIRSLWSSPLNGRSPVRLNRSLPTDGDVKNWDIAPDSSTVIYRADQRTNGVLELWAVPIAGGKRHRRNQTLPKGSDV